MTRVEQYLRDTRRAVYSCLFVVPLFIVYEILALSLQAFQITNLRNGADIMMRNMAGFIGLDRFPILVVLILIGLGVTAGYHQKRDKVEIHPSWFLLMILESAVYALILGSVALSATNFFLTIPHVFTLSQTTFATDFWISLMLSLGAGIHEELVFRLILIESSLYVGHSWFKDSPLNLDYRNAAIALIFSSLLFSIFHYVGPYGDIFDMDSFVFRTVSGVYLAFLYLARGFGIAAWTHALYDVFLLTGIL